MSDLIVVDSFLNLLCDVHLSILIFIIHSVRYDQCSSIT